MGFICLLLGLSCFVFCGCSSVKKAAVGQLADVLAQGGAVYASDEDPELIKQAAPFSLKLMESILEEQPGHAGLRQAAAAGFTQYAYAFVQQEADEVEGGDFAAAERLRGRARRLFLRAHSHALLGLESRHKGFGEMLVAGRVPGEARLGKEDAGLLYWAAASLGAALSLGKDDPALIARLPQVEELIDAALKADEAWGGGSIHSFLITFELGRQGGQGDAFERSRQHFERAVQLSGARSASPYLAYAEAVCIQKQDLAGFQEMLDKALALDPAAEPSSRLETLLMQQRARWLLARKSDLFLNAVK